MIVLGRRKAYDFCVICGSGMHGNVNCKKHPDGGHYRDYFYYACKYRTFVNGHKCIYRKQWSEDKINAAVEEIIWKLVSNPKFKTEILKHIGNSIDTQELDRYFDYIEDLIERENVFTMDEFEKSVNAFLEFRQYKLLRDNGKISYKQALDKAYGEYEIFNRTQPIESDFDKAVKEMIERDAGE